MQEVKDKYDKIIFVRIHWTNLVENTVYINITSLFIKSNICFQMKRNIGEVQT